ncbi:MAG TPA: hypothetical protein VFJ14_10605 [Nocardioidaceae bacterium]|nr:hypothetical protein [Nocardioidaceae bacterium]
MSARFPSDSPGKLLGTGVALRPVATPLPLGFLALVVATTTFSAVQLRWVGPDQATFAALTALLIVPLQLVASVFGFLSRDPVAGTGMGVLAGAWAVLGAATLAAPSGTTSPGLGVMLVAAAFALLVPAMAGISKPVAAVVMAVAATRFAVTGAAQLTGAPGWRTAAGVVGLVLAVVALYGALAFELEGVRGKAVLPLWRTGAAATAVSDDANEQLSGLEHEAGVRKQL